jgi:hypothetical protein
MPDGGLTLYAHAPQFGCQASLQSLAHWPAISTALAFLPATWPAAVLSACRQALYLMTGVATLGLLAALPGLRRGNAHIPDQVTEFHAVGTWASDWERDAV